MNFCIPPPTRGKAKPGLETEHTSDKVRSALGVQYFKSLHYTIAHLRRADGGLRLKSAANASCSMNLLSQGQRCGIHFILLHFKFTNFLYSACDAQVHNLRQRPPLRLLGLRKAFVDQADQLSVLSKKV